MPIDIAQQSRLIRRHGENVIHYRGQICSCSATGLLEEANINCRKCNGLGVFWNEPQVITATIVGLDSHRMGRQWLQNGRAPPARQREFKDYDKIIPTWPKGFPFSGELLRRGFKDTITYMPIGRIQRVSRVNPETGNETLWFQDVDYVMGGNENKEVVWNAGKGPSLDDVYAVTYEPRFEFVCWAPPAPRWERGRNLGRQILLRKVHLPWPTSNWS